MLEIRSSPIHGRGVFAKSLINKGEELTCEVIEVPYTHNDHKAYYYPWNGKISKSLAIGFGWFLNHTSKPNLKIYKIDKVNLTMTYKVLSNIKIGDELLINYGGKQNFEVNEKPN